MLYFNYFRNTHMKLNKEKLQKYIGRHIKYKRRVDKDEVRTGIQDLLASLILAISDCRGKLIWKSILIHFLKVTPQM